MCFSTYLVLLPIHPLNQNEETKLHATALELGLAGSATPIEPRQKRKGPKGPNPLSVKKKKPLSVLRTQQPPIPTPTESKLSGSKRKADDNSDQGVDNGDDITVLRKRKRKRRRKAIVDIEQTQTI